MHDLVSLAEAREHLRIDDSYEDSWLADWIPVVSHAVRRWVKDESRLYQVEVDSDGEPVLDSDGEPVHVLDAEGNPVPWPIVRGAVKIELASQYRYREGEGKDNVVPSDAGHGYVLNKASTALLSTLRRPTVSRRASEE
jgi:hypothetical protein